MSKSLICLFSKKQIPKDQEIEFSFCCWSDRQLMKFVDACEEYSLDIELSSFCDLSAEAQESFLQKMTEFNPENQIVAITKQIHRGNGFPVIAFEVFNIV